MPYIKPEHRQRLDNLVDELAQRIVDLSKETGGDGAIAGPLNYSCTRLALKVLRLRFGHIKYWMVAIVAGVFNNVTDEFYRRLVSPYEDKQIEKNGDVDLYQEFL